MILTRVDLPAPFSPSSAWISPGRTGKLTLSLARTPGKRLLIDLSSRRGATLASIGSTRDGPQLARRCGFPRANVDHNFRCRQRGDDLRPLIPKPARIGAAADGEHEPLDR